LHETTKLAILVFLAKKTSNTQGTKEQKTTKLGVYYLINKENQNLQLSFLERINAL